MDLFDVLNLIGGLCMFLLGMNLMGDNLEKFAGGGLRALLTKITDNPIKGFFVGLIVTSIIQSSSATTVMVVGFVGAGMMTLRQSVNVILGANVGTTITGWLVAMDDIGDATVYLKLLKPSSFCPVLALVGIVFVMMSKSRRKKDLGMIFLGFAVLMFGMDTMSGSVEGLRDMPEFQSILTTFTNPIMGILVGTIFTAIIQSSSASVGILQALSSTGVMTFSVAFPIILGQHIGTCITAMLSTIGASRDAKRTGLVHLYFNILNTAIIGIAFYALHAFMSFGFYDMVLDKMGIAIVHTVTNFVGTLIFLPIGKLLEKLAILTVQDKQDEDEFRLLDEHLLSSPAIALAQLMHEKDPNTEFLFVGAERGLEKDLVPKAGYDFKTVHISSFHRSLKPKEIRHNLISVKNFICSPAFLIVAVETTYLGRIFFPFLSPRKQSICLHTTTLRQLMQDFRQTFPRLLTNFSIRSSPRCSSSSL